MLDLSIRSPDLFQEMMNTVSEALCDNCGRPDRPDQGPVVEISFSWTDNGPCPFLCYALVVGNEAVEESDLPLSQNILGTRYDLFAYTIWSGGHYTAVFHYKRKYYKYDGLNPDVLKNYKLGSAP